MFSSSRRSRRSPRDLLLLPRSTAKCGWRCRSPAIFDEKSRRLWGSCGREKRVREGGAAGGIEGEGKEGLGWRSDPVLELGRAAMAVAAASSGAARVSKERKRGEGRDRRRFL
jgi:hypothetical protein